HVAAIAQAQDELLVAEVRVVAHEVPQNGPHPDVDQGLRNGIGVLAQARSESTAEKNDFHSTGGSVGFVGYDLVKGMPCGRGTLRRSRWERRTPSRAAGPMRGTCPP